MTTRRQRAIAWLAVALAAGACATDPGSGTASSSAAPVQATAPAGAPRVFVFQPKWRPEMKVWYTMPPGAGAQTPVVFALHGESRDAETLARLWAPHAVERRMIVVTPHFDREGYPTAREFNFGNWRNIQGRPTDPRVWTEEVIEEIFDDIRLRTGTRVVVYGLYGHSVGAQMAHRLLLRLPGARANRVVSANAGYYLVPGDLPEPLGLRETGIEPEQECRAYRVPMTVLLGALDNDPGHPQLNNAPGARAQGPHRVARGQHFFEAARSRAASNGCAFAWDLRLVPGVGHDEARMAAAAAALFH